MAPMKTAVGVAHRVHDLEERHRGPGRTKRLADMGFWLALLCRHSLEPGGLVVPQPSAARRRRHQPARGVDHLDLAEGGPNLGERAGAGGERGVDDRGGEPGILAGGPGLLGRAPLRLRQRRARTRQRALDLGVHRHQAHVHDLVRDVLLESELGLHRALLEARADGLAQQRAGLVDHDERPEGDERHRGHEEGREDLGVELVPLLRPWLPPLFGGGSSRGSKPPDCRKTRPRCDTSVKEKTAHIR